MLEQPCPISDCAILRRTPSWRNLAAARRAGRRRATRCCARRCRPSRSPGALTCFIYICPDGKIAAGLIIKLLAPLWFLYLSVWLFCLLKLGRLEMAWQLCVQQSRVLVHWRRYMALCCLPELGPKQAHAVVGDWPSLGALLAAYQDPARCAARLTGDAC